MWYGFCLVTRAICAPTRCCYQQSWGFNNVTMSCSLLLHHHFMLCVSTEVYGRRIYVLSSRKILHFKNQPCNRLNPEKPTRIHWLGYNDAVPLNKVKIQIFRPTDNFENSTIKYYCT